MLKKKNNKKLKAEWEVTRAISSKHHKYLKKKL